MTDKNTQRPLNSQFNLARAGSPKKLTDPAIAHGQKRQTKGELHPYLHGQSVDDEPNTTKSYEDCKPVPVHSGMTNRQKAAIHPVANDPSEILSRRVAPTGTGVRTPPGGLK